MQHSTGTGDDSARVSAQIEAAADAVLEGKQLLIDLDRRSNATREAKNALKKKKKSGQQRNIPGLLLTSKPRLDNDDADYDVACGSGGEAAPTWILCNGGTFVSFPRKAALEKLDLDQKETLRSINEARDALKDAVAELARLEGPDSALARLNSGFDLKAV